ncbi:MAG: hypothetical protein ACI8UD_003519, partial [Planctomycetota bacterium]
TRLVSVQLLPVKALDLFFVDEAIADTGNS